MTKFLRVEMLLRILQSFGIFTNVNFALDNLQKFNLRKEFFLRKKTIGILTS